MMETKYKIIIGGAGVLALAALSLFALGTTSVGSGEAGVKVSNFSGTDLESVLSEGLNFHPVWTNVEIYDMRVKVQNDHIPAQTSDGNDINIDVTVQYRPQRDNLARLHQKYGQDYAKTLIQPTIRSITREVSNGFGPEDLFSVKRKEFQKIITTQLRTKLIKEFVIVEHVLIRDIDLGRLKNSIARKVEARQELERQKIDNERKIIEATGRAAYQAKVSEKLTDRFIRFKSLENEEKRIQALKALAESKNTKILFMPIQGSGQVPAIINADKD